MQDYGGELVIRRPLCRDSVHIEGKIGREWNDFFRDIVIRFTQYESVRVYRRGGQTFKLTVSNGVASYHHGGECGGGMVKRSRRKGYGSSFLFFTLMPGWEDTVFKTGHFVSREGWLVLSLEPDPKVLCVDEAYKCWVAVQGRGHSICRKRRWLVRQGDDWAMRDTADNARLELLARSPEVKALGINVWQGKERR